MAPFSRSIVKGRRFETTTILRAGAPASFISESERIVSSPALPRRRFECELPKSRLN
jgi:hypothetical protein